MINAVGFQPVSEGKMPKQVDSSSEDAIKNMEKQKQKIQEQIKKVKENKNISEEEAKAKIEELKKQIAEIDKQIQTMKQQATSSNSLTENRGNGEEIISSKIPESQRFDQYISSKESKKMISSKFSFISQKEKKEEENEKRKEDFEKNK